MSRFFGIDLGSNDCRIGTVRDDGLPEVISFDMGLRQMPCAVTFDDDSILVGQPAINNAMSHQQALLQTLISISEFNRPIATIGGLEISPEVITTVILRKLAHAAEESLGEPVVDVVISCPASFGGLRREKTALAGQLAGLNVRALISQPTAAALAYTLHPEHQLDEHNTETLLLFNLQGKLFETSLIQRNGHSLRILLTRSSTEIGTDGWDDAVADYLLSQVENADGLLENPEGVVWLRRRLRMLAGHARRRLGEVNQVQIRDIVHPATIDTVLNRNQYVEITSDCVLQAVNVVDSFLRDAQQAGLGMLDQILAIGDAAHIPQLCQEMEYLCGQNALRFDPESAVAKGAAFYCLKLAIEEEICTASETGLDLTEHGHVNNIRRQVAERRQLEENFVSQLTDLRIEEVNGASIGLAAHDGQQTERIYCSVGPNEVVPRTAVHEVALTDVHERHFLVKIVENGRHFQEISDDWELLIVAVPIAIPPNMEPGSRVQIRISLDQHSRLGLEVMSPSTGWIETVEPSAFSQCSTADFDRIKELLSSFDLR